jgi:hypothetical protein
MNGVRRASAHSIVFQAREGTPELNCCSVNTPRGFGLLSEWALMRDREGLMLNYYGPGTLTAEAAPGVSVVLTQRTDYPLAGRIAIDVAPAEPATFVLKLRVPHWSARTQASLNGEPLAGVIPGTYLCLGREWRAGDRIVLDLDLSCHVWPGERECAGLASVYRGPILLAYDHRYNLDRATGAPEVRDIQHWDASSCSLPVPTLDGNRLEPRPAVWHEWLPPLLLLEFPTADGGTVRLVDFGSAGEAGTPYCSWLPMRHAPPIRGFSRQHPLRSVHVD